MTVVAVEAVNPIVNRLGYPVLWAILPSQDLL